MTPPTVSEKNLKEAEKILGAEYNLDKFRDLKIKIAALIQVREDEAEEMTKALRAWTEYDRIASISNASTAKIHHLAEIARKMTSEALIETEAYV